MPRWRPCSRSHSSRPSDRAVSVLAPTPSSSTGRCRCASRSPTHRRTATRCADRERRRRRAHPRRARVGRPGCSRRPHRGRREIAYDALCSRSARAPRPRYEHALTIDDRQLDETLQGLIQDVEGGYVKRIAFVSPGPHGLAAPAVRARADDRGAGVRHERGARRRRSSRPRTARWRSSASAPAAPSPSC